MDKSAIEQIQQCHTTDVLNSVLDQEDLAVPILVAPDNYKIHDLESKVPRS